MIFFLLIALHMDNNMSITRNVVKNPKVSLFNNMERQKGICSFFNEQRRNGKKIIALFAIGGGNDTFSAIHLGKYLHEFHDFKVIFFGVEGFTPYHTNLSIKPDLKNEEKVILATKDIKRFIMLKNLHQINNNEKEIPDILKAQGLDDCPYYLYSSKYPSQESAQSVKAAIDYELIQHGMNEQDLLVLSSDYGGDVLGHDLSTYSPDLDAFSVKMIQALDYSSSVPKLSLILWPGVDGELSKEALLSRFEELSTSILAKSYINDKSSYFETLIAIYERIKKSRLENTIPNAINILRQLSKGELHKSLTSCADSSKKYTVSEFCHLDITEDLVRTATLLPLAAIISINPFSQIEDQQDLFGFFIKVMNVYEKIKLDLSSQSKITQETKSYPAQERTDFHMQYLRLDDKGLWTSKNTGGELAMQILFSPTSYKDSQSNLLLEGGIKNIEDETVDIALASANQFKVFFQKYNQSCR